MDRSSSALDLRGISWEGASVAHPRGFDSLRVVFEVGKNSNMHHQLAAVEGWLELGNWREASEELHNLPPSMKSSIEVLRLWVRVYRLAEAWPSLEEVADLLLAHVPGDPLGVENKAEALHRQGRSADAVIFLGAFKSLFTIPESYYNLARYLCANGQGGDAREMLRFAIEGDKKLKKRAIEDPELAGVWGTTKNP